MKYLHFPGCAAESTEPESLVTSQRLFAHFGIAIAEEEGFACCGARILDEINYELNLAVNARNFAIAEQKADGIVTICNTCYLTMLHTRKELAKRPDVVSKINETLAPHNLKYSGTVALKHLLNLFEDEAVFARFNRECNSFFTGKRILPFYGCHIARPEILFGARPLPEVMDQLLTRSGAEVVRSSIRADCCGFHTVMADQEITMQVLRECLDDAGRKRIDYIVTPCPLCHINLDMYQVESGTEYTIPVLHISQYLLAALGYPRADLALDKHIVSVKL